MVQYAYKMAMAGHRDMARRGGEMKLSKKNRARQRTISRMLASGKALGGLLAGVAATMFAGCRDNSPRVPMGDYPNPDAQSNAVRESHSRSGRMGKYLINDPEKADKTNEKKDAARE